MSNRRKNRAAHRKKNRLLWLWALIVFLGWGCTTRFGQKNENGDSGLDGGAAVCGNGVLEAGEVCDGTDLGGQTCTSAIGHLQGQLACTAECRLDLTDCSTCGDGRVEGSEGCDDANTAADDGCSPTCETEPGWICSGEPSACNFTCSNGQLDEGEACDDGNLEDGDGCSSACTVEPGWDCEGEPTYCAPICGDGLIVGLEACDDGNTEEQDGCSSICTIEAGWTCEGTPSICTTTCGDGVLAVGEDCDDGNESDGDGCSQSCAIEDGWQCEDEPSLCIPVCGDGLTRGDEQCDDNNTENGDGCSSSCITEQYSACHGEPSECKCVVYIDIDANGGANDGTRWQDAYTDIEDGIDTVRYLYDCEAWVAEGTYYVYQSSPTQDVDLRDNVRIFGGFTGTETTRGQRDWVLRATVLDGRQSAGSMARVHNVVEAVDVNNARLDGFVITQGSASPNAQGGGLHAENCSGLEIVNCHFVDNSTMGRGGAVWMEYSDATFRNTIFETNEAITDPTNPDTGDGGGVIVTNGAVVFDSCLFVGNIADDDGGGLDVWEGTHTIVNCVFFENSADDVGGGLRIWENGHHILTNSVIYANQANNGGGLTCSYGCILEVTNTILWQNNPTQIATQNANLDVRYSNVENDYAGTGNIDGDPLFVDPNSGDFQLSASSPCIDAGDGSAAPDVDKAGNSRVDDPNTNNTGTGTPDYVDLGAFEYQP